MDQNTKLSAPLGSNKNNLHTSSGVILSFSAKDPSLMDVTGYLVEKLKS
ncbi:hypothetical protein KAU32_09100 [bacterium]|nr:hypothetical protein [bacterium]